MPKLVSRLRTEHFCEKVFASVVFRCSEYFLGAALLYNIAIIHKNDTVGDISGKVHFMDVKKLLYSERSRKAYKFHHIKDQLLNDSVVKSSSLIIICYLVLFGIGTMMGTFYGYPLASSAFEAASVTGNVGLSIGVTSPAMPTVMKIYYIIAMYMGRLEFLSVFALFGYVAGGIKKLCTKSIKTVF